MLHSKVFLPGRALQTSAGRLSTTIKMLPVKTQEFGLNKATGLKKEAVECVVLVSDRFNSLRVSRLEVSMYTVGAITVCFCF